MGVRVGNNVNVWEPLQATLTWNISQLHQLFLHDSMFPILFKRSQVCGKQLGKKPKTRSSWGGFNYIMPQYINVVFGKFLFEHICQHFWIWRIQVIERKINNKLKSLQFRFLIPLTPSIRTKTTVWCKMKYYWSQRFVQFPCLLMWQCKAVQGDKVFYQFDFAPCSCQVWIQQKIPLSTWLF